MPTLVPKLLHSLSGPRCFTLRSFVRTVERALLFLIISFCFMEGGFRILGYSPLPPVSGKMHETAFEPDPVLGWRSKPGSYTSVAHDGSRRTVTILPSGARATGAAPTTATENVLVVGCSFTNGGFYLNDNQTYAWKLQQRHPELAILNYGTNAYGSYQSLLLLEQLLASTLNVKHVIYSFISYHGSRNVNSWLWAKGLATLNSESLAVPYAELDSGNNIIRHLPELYPHIPFDRYSALVSAVEDVYAARRAGPRDRDMLSVTVRIAQLMKRAADAHGARFSLVDLYQDPQDPTPYLEEFRSAGIDALDCRPRTGNLESYALPEDRHPNEALNSYWAECLSQGIFEKR